MNEAIVRGGEWRQQGEEGRLGWPVYWLDHMFSWPACYSALSSLHPLTEELELELLEMITQNATEQHSQIVNRNSMSLLHRSHFQVSFVSFLLNLCKLSIFTLSTVCFHKSFSQVTPPFGFCLSLLQQLYTRGHHCAMNSSTDWVRHYHVKWVKPRVWPSVFTTCVTQGALSTARAHRFAQTGYIKSKELSQNGSTCQVHRRQSAHLGCDCSVLEENLLHRGYSWLLYETNLLRNGSELLAVMVRASWAIGEDTGFVLPSWSILVGSWFLIASSCGW